MKKIIYTGFIIVISTVNIYAQSFTDALRFSQVTTQGNARFNAMAGSMGALGADISTASTNPAGLGLNRKNEFQIGLGFFNQTSISTYQTVQTKDQKCNVNLPNVSLLIHSKLNDNESEKPWKSISFGINYNRNNNYHKNISLTGFSKESIADNFVKNARGNFVRDLDPFTTSLAYYAYVIDTVAGKNDIYLKNSALNGNNKTKNIIIKGASSDFNLSFGTNYKNKLYLGATVSFAYINYTENNFYTEQIQNTDTIALLKSIKFNESLTTDANGWNLKLGAIYRPFDFFRIGAALHTPTIYTMKDFYNTDINVETTKQFDTIVKNFKKESPSGEFDYKLNTPVKGVFSAAVIIKKRFALNLDYEIQNYGSAYFSANAGNVYNFTNQEINNQGTLTQNIKIGAEFKLDDFFLRGGYAMYGEPFKQNLSLNKYRYLYSGGLGYRGKHFSIDLAYVYQQNKSVYYLYSLSNSDFAKNDFNSSTFTASVSYRF